VFHLVRAILGLKADAHKKTLYVNPGQWLREITLHNLRAGTNTATLRFWKKNSETRHEVLSSEEEHYVSQELRREVDIDSIRAFGS
jgi:hypothetical protein